MEDVFNNAAMNEFQRALSELGREKTPQLALKKSFVRYENLIASSIEESETKPACKAGCGYCCYYKVEVKAHEMFLIKEHMEKNFEEPQMKAVLQEANTNSAFIRTLTHAQHLTTNIKCPFLMENKCSIYSVRPFTCRNLHSTDYDSCEKSHIDPTDLTIENSFIERVALFGSAHSQGFEAAAQQAGLDSRTYDLNTALVEVFEEPAAIKRFRRGKKAFLKAIEVKDEEQNA